MQDNSFFSFRSYPKEGRAVAPVEFEYVEFVELVDELVEFVVLVVLDNDTRLLWDGKLSLSCRRFSALIQENTEILYKFRKY